MIEKIIARQILDSRGNPTLEAELTTKSGFQAIASVPSGASTGKHEAVELRDQNPKYYLGKSVLKAVKNVNGEIFNALKGMDVQNQSLIDQSMIQLDGTKNKSRLGANAILAFSLACMKAAAMEKNTSIFQHIASRDQYFLPIPMMNIINGGEHGDNKIDFQEFMIMPIAADSFSDALQMGVEVFHHLKKVLSAKGFSTNVGDEGGFAPNIASNDQALETVLEAIIKAGYQPGKDIYIALDAATSEMYDEKTGKYHFYKSSGKKLSGEELIRFWESWVNQYPIVSIEDGLAEDDWHHWQMLTEHLGAKVQLVGDDLFVTDSQRLSKGIKSGVANSILIKFNQIGTITQTLETIEMAQKKGYSCVISHRSGETEDTTIADLAVGTQSGQIKTGSLSRTDRLAKYNQLLRIEEKLGDKAVYYGKEYKFVNNQHKQ